MNIRFKWLFLVLLFAAPAYAQNVRVDNVAFSSVQGFPFLPGATITICTAAGSGVPCTPTVAGTCLSISDATCNQSATLTSDAFGNYGFWIQPGSYTYTVTKAGFGGFGPRALTLAVPSAGTGPGTFTNLTVTGTGTLSGNVTATAGQNVITAFNFANGTRIVDGNKYANTTAGVQSAVNDACGTGNITWVPTGTSWIATSIAQCKNTILLDQTGIGAASNPVFFWRVPQGLAWDLSWLPRTGTVNTSGTTVTWVSGDQFITEFGLETQMIINGTHFRISAGTCTTTQCTLTTSAGTQTGVNYEVDVVPNNLILENGAFTTRFKTAPASISESFSAPYRVFEAAVTGESNGRFDWYLGGRIEWGPGTARDIAFYRNGVSLWQLDTNGIANNLELRMGTPGAQTKLISMLKSDGVTACNQFGLLTNDVTFIGGAGCANIISIRPDGTERVEVDNTQFQVEVPMKLTSGNTIAQYGGVTTAGQGVPFIPGATLQRTETGTADANVLTVTPPAATGTYRACVVVSVSSATTGVISWTLSWTDSNGNAQANIAQPLFQFGTAAPNTTFTTSAAGNYEGCSMIDVNSAAANIVVKWVGGGTTAAKMSATIERII